MRLVNNEIGDLRMPVLVRGTKVEMPEEPREMAMMSEH